MDDVEDLRRLQRDFVRERDWAQFHTPKNVAMALVGEVGELAEAASRGIAKRPGARR
jgi:dCTP diphosphatase